MVLIIVGLRQTSLRLGERDDFDYWLLSNSMSGTRPVFYFLYLASFFMVGLCCDDSHARWLLQLCAILAEVLLMPASYPLDRGERTISFIAAAMITKFAVTRVRRLGMRVHTENKRMHTFEVQLHKAEKVQLSPILYCSPTHDTTP